MSGNGVGMAATLAVVVFRRASQEPQGRVVPLRGVQGKARSPVTYCSQRQQRQRRGAGRAESLGVFEGLWRSSSPVHRTFVSGCEGPSIAVLRSVLVV